MIGIITGDIVNSRRKKSIEWINDFKKILNSFGKSPADWEIFRGDEFQIEIKNPENVLIAAIQIKAYFKSLKLDVRMSIGLGDKNYKSKKISESNGTAFARSGEVFETLKKQKINLAINSGNVEFDLQINLMLRLCLTFMNNWLVQSAEFILVAIKNQKLSQEEIGLLLGINQAAVSRRRKRANYDLMQETDKFFRLKVKNLDA
jgi:predicted XRE-type DNA-binding protein